MRLIALGLLMVIFSSAASARVAMARPGEADPRTLPADQRDQALRLADEGAKLFDQNDFEGARDRFERAEAIIPIPPFSYQRGRALERLGKWTEALECYQRAATTPLPADAPAQHQAAKRDAQRAAEALTPKVPRLTVSIAGGAAADVFIDGRSRGPVSPTPLLVNPGPHTLEAKGHDGSSARREIQPNPSESMSVELKLTQGGVAPPPTSDGPTTLAIIGWVGIAAGGASLAIATGTGIAAIMKRSDLDAACPSSACPEAQWDNVDSYDALRWTAGATLIGGLVLAAGGTAAIVFDPDRKLFGKAIVPEVGPMFARITVRLP